MAKINNILFFHISYKAVLLDFLDTFLDSGNNIYIIMPERKKNDLTIKSDNIKIITFNDNNFSFNSLSDKDKNILEDTFFSEIYLISKIKKSQNISYYKNILSFFYQIKHENKYIVYSNGVIKNLNSILIRYNHFFNTLFQIPFVQQFLTLLLLPVYLLNFIKQYVTVNYDEITGYGGYWHLAYLKKTDFDIAVNGIFKYVKNSGGGYMTGIVFSPIKSLFKLVFKKKYYDYIFFILFSFVLFLLCGKFSLKFFVISIFLISPMNLFYFFKTDNSLTNYGFLFAVASYILLFNFNMPIISGIVFGIMVHFYLPNMFLYGGYFLYTGIYLSSSFHVLFWFFITGSAVAALYVLPLTYFIFTKKTGINYVFDNIVKYLSRNLLESFKKFPQCGFYVIYYVLFMTVYVFQKKCEITSPLIIYPLLCLIIYFFKQSSHQKNLYLLFCFNMIVVLSRTIDIYLVTIFFLFIFLNFADMFFSADSYFNINIAPYSNINEEKRFVENFRIIPQKSRIVFENLFNEKNVIAGKHTINYYIDYLLKENNFEIFGGVSISDISEEVISDIKNISADSSMRHIYDILNKYSFDFIITYSNEFKELLLKNNFILIFCDVLYVDDREIQIALFSYSANKIEKIYNVYPGMKDYGRKNYIFENDDFSFSMLKLITDCFCDLKKARI